jgi:hypothetical protein
MAQAHLAFPLLDIPLNVRESYVRNGRIRSADLCYRLDIAPLNPHRDKEQTSGMHMLGWLKGLFSQTPLDIAEPVDAAPAPDDAHSFDRAKAAFDQNFLQFRHLNDQLNRVPTLAVTLTGGFWYVAVIQKFPAGTEAHQEAIARFALMIFATIANLMLIQIAIRIRDVMSGYWKRIAEFMGVHAPEKAAPNRFVFGDYSMISMYATMMLAGALLSGIGAFVLFWPRTGLSFCVAAGSALAACVAIVVIANGLPRWLGRQS